MSSVQWIMYLFVFVIAWPVLSEAYCDDTNLILLLLLLFFPVFYDSIWIIINDLQRISDWFLNAFIAKQVSWLLGKAPKNSPYYQTREVEFLCEEMKPVKPVSAGLCLVEIKGAIVFFRTLPIQYSTWWGRSTGRWWAAAVLRTLDTNPWQAS